MPDLTSPKHISELLQRHRFSIRKKYGQNFLVDRNILEKVVGTAAIAPSDSILEIGPGAGTMTALLAQRAKNVIAVEIDQALIPILGETLAEFDNVTIENEDILKVDLAALAMRCGDGRPIKVVANLPYYITTPVIMALLESRIPLESITIMVQKEVAERIRSASGRKDYGALTVAVNYYTRVEYIATVSPSCFFPRPAVDSAILHLDRYQTPPVEVADEAHFFKLIRAAFAQRRKVLANALVNAACLDLTREDVFEALAAMGKSLTVRGEELGLEEFTVLSNLLVATATKR